MILLCIFAAVTAMFDQAEYTVEEDNISLQVCIQIEGSLRRNVNFTLQMMESTAQGINDFVIQVRPGLEVVSYEVKVILNCCVIGLGYSNSTRGQERVRALPY